MQQTSMRNTQRPYSMSHPLLIFRFFKNSVTTESSSSLFASLLASPTPFVIHCTAWPYYSIIIDTINSFLFRMIHRSPQWPINLSSERLIPTIQTFCTAAISGQLRKPMVGGMKAWVCTCAHQIVRIFNSGITYIQNLIFYYRITGFCANLCSSASSQCLLY